MYSTFYSCMATVQSLAKPASPSCATIQRHKKISLSYNDIIGASNPRVRPSRPLKYPSTLATSQKPLHLIPLDLLCFGRAHHPAPDLPRLCSRLGVGLLFLKCLLLLGGHDDNGFTPLPIPSTTTTLLTVTPHLINRANMDHNADIGGINS